MPTPMGPHYSHDDQMFPRNGNDELSAYGNVPDYSGGGKRRVGDGTWERATSN